MSQTTDAGGTRCRWNRLTMTVLSRVLDFTKRRHDQTSNALLLGFATRRGEAADARLIKRDIERVVDRSEDIGDRGFVDDEDSRDYGDVAPNALGDPRDLSVGSLERVATGTETVCGFARFDVDTAVDECIREGGGKRSVATPDVLALALDQSESRHCERGAGVDDRPATRLTLDDRIPSISGDFDGVRVPIRCRVTATKIYVLWGRPDAQCRCPGPTNTIDYLSRSLAIGGRCLARLAVDSHVCSVRAHPLDLPEGCVSGELAEGRHQIATES